MTAETIQRAPAEEKEESFHIPQMCDGKQWIPEDCDSSADYRCKVSCCGGVIWWCEECLFAFVEVSKEFVGYQARCVFCGKWVEICPEHVEVIGRIA